MKRPLLALTRLLRAPSAAIGAAVLLLLLGAAATAGWLYPGDPLEMVGAPFTWPGADAEFPAGTDLMGRDILAGLFHGARISLLVGGASAAIALALGLLVGAIAGYAGPRVDAVLMRLTELFQTVPSFLLAIVLVAILGPSLSTIIFALGVTSWTGIARLTRGEFITLREREFVRAAQALGAGHARIIFHPVRGRPVVPRPGRPQRGQLGQHGRRRPRSAAHRLVHDRPARPDHHGRGAGAEPAERRHQ